MAKLTGYLKVALIEADSDYGERCYCIYDDGIDYQVGDTVCLSTNNRFSKIRDILTTEEFDNMKRSLSGEIICKVDTSAYNERVRRRKEKEKIKKALDKRKKEVTEMLEDAYFAQQDTIYADLLKQYNDL